MTHPLYAPFQSVGRWVIGIYTDPFYLEPRQEQWPYFIANILLFPLFYLVISSLFSFPHLSLITTLNKTHLNCVCMCFWVVENLKISKPMVAKFLLRWFEKNTWTYTFESWEYLAKNYLVRSFMLGICILSEFSLLALLRGEEICVLIIENP